MSLKSFLTSHHQSSAIPSSAKSWFHRLIIADELVYETHCRLIGYLYRPLIADENGEIADEMRGQLLFLSVLRSKNIFSPNRFLSKHSPLKLRVLKVKFHLSRGKFSSLMLNSCCIP